MAARGAGGPSRGRTADTACLKGRGQSTPTRRSPIPILDAVRARPDEIRARLEANTRPLASTECLIWTGARNADGRGRMPLRVDGRRSYVVVSRVVYALEHDVEPGERLVLHGPCDRPECVAVEHLRLGDYFENARDAVERGRARLGEAHPFARLRRVDVEFVLARLGTHTDTEIARALGGIVCRRTVNGIRRGETWRHLSGFARPARFGAWRSVR